MKDRCLLYPVVECRKKLHQEESYMPKLIYYQDLSRKTSTYPEGNNGRSRELITLALSALLGA